MLLLAWDFIVTQRAPYVVHRRVQVRATDREAVALPGNSLYINKKTTCATPFRSTRAVDN